MALYGRSSRALVEETLQTGTITDSQIIGCDLTGLITKPAHWTKTDFRELSANDIVFNSADFNECVFFRASMVDALFSNCSFDSTILDGLSLIKSRWNSSTLHSSILKNGTLQRSTFTRVIFSNCTIADIEAVAASVTNCIFSNCLFEITYGCGMNGFSGATISGCIFRGCRFSGYPLRGCTVRDSVFSHCHGDIGDNIEETNTVGVSPAHISEKKNLVNPDAARALLSNYMEEIK